MRQPDRPDGGKRCQVVELRQYDLYPGRRDELIDLFENELIESQEVLGMRVIGQFRDLDEPDRFVWLRGFSDMRSRARSLEQFYSGPVWAAHRKAATSTMINSNDVLLLRPLHEGGGFSFGTEQRPTKGEWVDRGLFVAMVHYLDDHSLAPSRVELFEATLRGLAASAGSTSWVPLLTERSPNNFPQLPVREGEFVFAWFAGFRNVIDSSRFLNAVWESSLLGEELAHRTGGRRSPQVLRLSPTSRSLLHG